MKKEAIFLRILVAQNGLRWTVAYSISHVLKAVLARLDRWIDGFEKRNELPGLSGAATNRRIWETYDWGGRGEEWTSSPEWKRSVIELIEQRVRGGAAVLELGPGAGRWTEVLQRRAGSLTLVDVSPACLDLCKARFAACSNVRYLLNDGRTLREVEAESIDFIWSFDAFVHISPDDTASYASEFRRVLRSGGRGMVHHPAAAGLRGGFRSRMTSALFSRILQGNGLVPLEQFDSWGPDGRFDVRHYQDCITVFEKR